MSFVGHTAAVKKVAEVELNLCAENLLWETNK